MAEHKVISMNPADFVQGGLIQDVDVEVLSSKWVDYNYEGRAATLKDPVLALCLELAVEGQDEPHIEYISAGSTKDFVPNPDDDGDTIARNGTAERLRKGSNYDLFAQTLVQAGFPGQKLTEGKASNLKGIKMHIVRRPQPKRTGLNQQEEGGYEKTFLAVEKLISTPWDKRQTAAGKKPAAAPKPAATATASAPAEAAAENGNGEVPAEIAERAMELVSGIWANTPMKLALFKMKLNGLLKGDPNQAAIVNAATTGGVLEPLGLKLDGEVVTSA